MEVTLLTSTSSDSIAKLLLTVSVILFSADLEVLSPKKECYHQDTPSDSTELEVQTAAKSLWALHASRATGKEGTYSAVWDD